MICDKILKTIKILFVFIQNLLFDAIFIRQNAKPKIYFSVSHPPKCIANLCTQPMHFKMNLEIYQTSFVMKEDLCI